MSRCAPLFPRIDELARTSLGARRYRHSRNAAELSARLCALFGEDPDKGRAAGLAHDVARELSPGKILRLAGTDGLPISGEEARNPVLLHGRASAVLLESWTGCSEAETLQAIRDHVTGRPSMPALSRILFCADILEEGRDFKVREREKTLKRGLDAMTRAVLLGKMRWVKSGEGGRISASARALLKELS